MMETLGEPASIVQLLIHSAIVDQLVSLAWQTYTADTHNPILRVWFNYLEHRWDHRSTLCTPLTTRRVVDGIYPAYMRMKQAEFQDWDVLDLCDDIVNVSKEYSILTSEELRRQLDEQHVVLNPDASRKKFGY